MKISSATRYRLKSILSITVVIGLVGAVFQLVVDGRISPWGFGLGAALGFMLGVLEWSALARRIGRLPFVSAALVKSAVYVAIVAGVFLSGAFAQGLASGKTLSDFFVYMTSPMFFLQLTFTFAFFLIVVAVRQVNRLLGPGVLLRYIHGRYHRPRREERIFLFLDLKSSTSIAEQLGPEAYSAFLQMLYAELDEAIIETRGELFQYVGDEVVMVWTTRNGVENHNCIRFFFLVEKRIEELKDAFVERFGVVPEFKAGLHYGEVLIAEIGSYRKDIAYHGDPINTASRICATCNKVGKRFLFSADMLAFFSDLKDEYDFTVMGMFDLKGKKKAVGLLSIEERAESSH
jgi:adenylate cyclase